MKVNCSQCGKELNRKPSHLKQYKTFFCSKECKGVFQKGKPTWNKGLTGLPKHTEEHKRKIGAGVKNSDGWKRSLKKIIANLKSPEVQRKAHENRPPMSGEKNGMYGRTGNKNPNWKGGVSYWRKAYYNSIPYKNWQKEVFKRDNYRCRICGAEHKNGVILHSHHINSFSKYPVLRLDVNNGITLCHDCHSIIHSKKGRGII